MVQVMGLSNCKHTVIGTRWRKGVSGGEAKRVSIGTCLLQRPRCLFLVSAAPLPLSSMFLSACHFASARVSHLNAATAPTPFVVRTDGGSPPTAPSPLLKDVLQELLKDIL
jgi:hypothetical protein